METRFFILDCQENIVGNHKGYRTHKGAIIALRMNGQRLEKQLWKRFDDILKSGNKPAKPATIWTITNFPIVKIETIKE